MILSGSRDAGCSDGRAGEIRPDGGRVRVQGRAGRGGVIGTEFRSCWEVIIIKWPGRPLVGDAPTGCSWWTSKTDQPRADTGFPGGRRGHCTMTQMAAIGRGFFFSFLVFGCFTDFWFYALVLVCCFTFLCLLGGFGVYCLCVCFCVFCLFWIFCGNWGS